MLKNYISKLVCLATLCAFFLQPQWFEGISASKTQHNHVLNISKTAKLFSYVLQSDNENESDDDSLMLCSVPQSFVFGTKPIAEKNSSKTHPEVNTLHRLQERPIWLTARKILL